MKRSVLLLFLVFNVYFLIGQKLDLIVTTDGDSIACKIDSISEGTIYFTARKNYTALTSHIELIAVSEYRKNCIEKGNVKPIPGTIFFHSRPLEYASLRKNVIYATVGFFGIYGTASGHLERMIIPYSNRFPLSIWVNVGGGGYVAWEDEGNWFSGTVHATTGKKSNHIEFSLGVAFLHDTYYDRWGETIAGGVGYRYQKPEGFFIFRTGISYPESAYLSLGFAF